MLVFFPKDAVHTHVHTQSEHKIYSMSQTNHIESIHNTQSQESYHKITFRDCHKELPIKIHKPVSDAHF